MLRLEFGAESMNLLMQTAFCQHSRLVKVCHGVRNVSLSHFLPDNIEFWLLTVRVPS